MPALHQVIMHIGGFSGYAATHAGVAGNNVATTHFINLAAQLIRLLRIHPFETQRE